MSPLNNPAASKPTLTLATWQDPLFDLEQIKTLFREYNAYLGIDLSFQDFETELQQLHLKYHPEQKGQLYLAYLNTENPIENTAENPNQRSLAVGCAGIYGFSPTIAELKRLFVRPTAHGFGVGRQLISTAIRDARALGYQTLYLDSLQRLTAARKLYDSLGFQDIPPYNENPYSDVYYMALTL